MFQALSTQAYTRKTPTRCFCIKVAFLRCKSTGFRGTAQMQTSSTGWAMGKSSASCSDPHILLAVQSQSCSPTLPGEPAVLAALPISLQCAVQPQLLIWTLYVLGKGIVNVTSDVNWQTKIIEHFFGVKKYWILEAKYALVRYFVTLLI